MNGGVRLDYARYRKVASSRLSRLVAHSRIFRMKGKFDAVTFGQKTSKLNSRLHWSTAHDLTVHTYIIFLGKTKTSLYIGHRYWLNIEKTSKRIIVTARE